MGILISKDEIIRDRLNEWSVSKYTDCKYLFVIPNSVRVAQIAKIRDQLDQEEFGSLSWYTKYYVNKHIFIE